MTEPTANNCCGIQCPIGDTEDLDTNVVGTTWSYSASPLPKRYSVNETDALRVSSIGTANPWKITADIHSDPQMSPPYPTTKHYLRLIGGYLDDENYYFAEYRFETTAMNELWAQHIIGKVETGTETFLSYDPWAFISGAESYGGRCPFRMDLCWTGFNLRSQVTYLSGPSGCSGLLNRRISTDQNISSCFGEKFGIGTGTELNTTFQFRDIVLEHNAFSNEDCETCFGTACDSTLPDTAVVEITNDSTANDPTMCPTSSNAHGCSLLDGTYNLTRVQGGDGSDRHLWRLITSTSWECFNGLIWTVCSGSTTFQLLFDQSLSRWELVISRSISGCQTVSKWVGFTTWTGAMDCQAWTDLRQMGGGAPDLFCAKSPFNVTAKVKMA